MSTIVNDFNFTVATVNGSGSQSSNIVLMRAIFNMGVPVSGKNLFPSNIAGLPTWFTVRANKDGYVARRVDDDIRVCMNAATVDEDLAKLKPGAYAIVNDSISSNVVRDDLHLYSVPFTKLVGGVVKEMKLRKLVVNMIYVGVLGELLGLDEGTIHQALETQFQGKPKAVQLNHEAVQVGRDYVKANPLPEFPYRIERMTATDGKIIIDGNAAGGLGAVFGGLTVLAWYPITPSSSICESAMSYLKRLRHDEDGKAKYAVVQAEDELASIGMVVGAGWAGARAMTSTSGPGISLMSEFAGLSYYAEVPAVIWDIQRVGPSTGLPTRTAQGDVSMVASLSHGDTQHIVLFPATVEECFQFGQESFDLAEEFQTLVFVLSDLDLGMNLWMADPFEYIDKPYARGKVLNAEQLEAAGEYGRYRDVDGDGVPYRTIPGNSHPKAAYFCRGSGHDENANYTESAEVYKRNLDRLSRKFDTARDRIPAPILDSMDGATIGIIAFGTSDSPMREARDLLAAAGIKTDYLRLRALPLNEAVNAFIDAHDHVFVVEQNRDAQMAGLIKLHCGDIAHKTTSLLHYNGMPIHARFIVDGVTARVGQKIEV